MNNMITTQLLQEAMANVDIPLVVALMALGFIIKHFSLFEKIENNLIPPVLLVFSIIVLVCRDGLTGATIIPTIISAIVNAAVAIGLHQQGKNIFTITVIPSITEALGGLFGKEPEAEEEPEIQEEESEVDEVVEE